MEKTDNHIASVPSVLEPDEVLARLEALSKRGQLAGFERGGSGDAAASFAAHGTPFDGRVLVRPGAGSVAFDLRMPWRGPAAFGLALAFTVWPGLPITNSFLQSLLWYERLTSGWLDTWMWYVPLAALPAPFALLTAVRRSRAAATAHATETVERVRGVVER